MIAQFAIGRRHQRPCHPHRSCSRSTDGFLHQFGDGAADILLLFGLNKRRVRAFAAHLDGPPELVAKVPTADLETSSRFVRMKMRMVSPTKDQIDDFLEGREIDDAARTRIMQVHA